MRLISDLKTFLVIHDFPAINETIKKQTDDLQKSVSHEHLSVFLWNGSKRSKVTIHSRQKI